MSICIASEAFRSVRDSVGFNKEKQERFHVQHSELHLLYITFLVLIVGAITVYYAKPDTALISHKVLIFIAFSALLSGIIGNIMLCRQECKAMLQIGKNNIALFLKESQFNYPSPLSKKKEIEEQE